MTIPAATAPADLPLSSPPSLLLRALRNTSLFLAACAAGCAIIGRVAPFQEVPGIYPKWTHFHAQRDEFDVLFLGSSRFFHQIIPAQFDAALGAAGMRVRSFNFGYDGMWPPESYYLLRQILALRPARLKWVVIDLMEINTELDDRNNSTLRMAYWHDLRHTALAFRDILASRFPWHRKAEFLSAHGHFGVQQALNLGRGAEVLGRLLAPKPPRKKEYVWEGLAGFEPGPESRWDEAKRGEFVTAVERLRKNLPPCPVRPVFRRALSELIADVRRAGAEPIFVIAPTINDRENFSEIPGGAAVFAFNSPREYPELFDPDRHYDAWHLNPKGAVDFTALLARKFIERAAAPR